MTLFLSILAVIIIPPMFLVLLLIIAVSGDKNIADVDVEAIYGEDESADDYYLDYSNWPLYLEKRSVREWDRIDKQIF